MANHPNRSTVSPATEMHYWHDERRNSLFWLIRVDEGYTTRVERGASTPTATYADWEMKRHSSFPHGHANTPIKSFLRGRLDSARNRMTPVNGRSKIVGHDNEAAFDRAARAANETEE